MIQSYPGNCINILNNIFLLGYQKIGITLKYHNFKFILCPSSNFSLFNNLFNHFSIAFLLIIAWKQVVSGLLYLHGNGIMHRDLTLANLMLTRDFKGGSMNLLFFRFFNICYFAAAQ